MPELVPSSTSKEGFGASIRVLMMPRDTNPQGTIFGGVILSYIDQAGAEAAHAGGADRVVTVAMKEVVFHEPVFVGDLVTYWTRLEHIGRTSLKVRVIVEAARNWDRNEIVRVTEADISYVNVNPDRRPIPVRPKAGVRDALKSRVATEGES